MGLIVNPIAGMGGRIGLKGSDGILLAQALDMGAVFLSGSRAAECLRCAVPERDRFDLFAGGGVMGEDSARSAGLEPIVVGHDIKDGAPTSAEDTAKLAVRMLSDGIDLILFAGGDGTARDICGAVGERALVLGIPAGVKIHSAVFAKSPREAGRLLSEFVSGSRARRSERLCEVMDIDEDAYRNGSLSARLFGYMRVPYEKGRIQGLKSGTPASDSEAQASAAAEAALIIESEMDTLFFIGAGTTTRALKAALCELGESGTLLGVDAWLGGRLMGTDLAERDIIGLMDKHPHKRTRIVITPIGGQGFIFGRGSQQFSPDVIRRAGKENIMLLSSPAKLQSLAGEPLLIDTGDAELDEYLGGYYKIISGLGQYTIYRARQS
ncbi:MAG: ATP-NAD kinase family protein [Synergistaceae bacterium]|nr:ATP-NAD kinase family protein [Synergistaceae bacterium]